MSPEDMQRYVIYAAPTGSHHAAIGIHHAAHCPSRWYAEVEDFTALAELVQRAEEHGEVCR